MQDFELSRLGKGSGARFPVYRLDLIVAQLKGVCGGYGIDQASCLLLLCESDFDPDIFQRIRDLTEQAVNVGEARRQQLMDAVFDGAAIPQVVDVHGRVDLTDTLDAPFALLQSGGVPGEIQIDQRAQTLQVQTFRGRIRADQQTDLPCLYLTLDLVARECGPVALPQYA